MAISMIPPAASRPFLHSLGWEEGDILPLAGDASFRRYFRVVDGARRAVLMDAPPPHEDPRPFLGVAEHLSAQGFAAPAIYGTDLEQGLVLLEDFGDARVRDHLDEHPADEEAIYARAVRLLADLHRAAPVDAPPYDREVYQREAGLLTEWYCPAAGLDVDAAGYAAAWDEVLPLVERDDAPKVTVLRDYHAENIMLIDGRPQSHDLGLLDFQDALVGHPAYDLVSLLQDARRDVGQGTEAAMVARFVAATGADPQAFAAHYAALGAQRALRILGVFVRLALVAGKPGYLPLIPRVWGQLQQNLAHPALAGLRAVCDRLLPPPDPETLHRIRAACPHTPSR